MENIGHAQLLEEFEQLLDEQFPNTISDNVDAIMADYEESKVEKVEEPINDPIEEAMALEAEALEEEVTSAEEEISDELLWQARTGLNPDTLCGAIETIIFMSDRPVPLAKIRNLIDEETPLRIIHEALLRLQTEYEAKHHGLRLLEVAEGYQFRTKATYSKYVQDLFKVNSLVLSPTALEVLAIISYKQPVSKNEIEKIRGVDSSHIVRGLMDKRLVKVAGRSEELGRPVVYGTTPEFLEVFNLADISQLPPEHELESMADNSIGKIADIKSICAGDKTQFIFDELGELDELSSSIKSISADTVFTKSLKVEEKKRFSEAGVQARSAFDLLEEFVDRDLITTENLASADSETIMTVTCPEVVTDLLAGPFNAPEVEEEFEMIDLDTGEAIVASEEELEIEVELEADDVESEELELAEENSEVEEVSTPVEEKVAVESDDKTDYLFSTDNAVAEADSLEAALEAAFSNLTGETLLTESAPLASEEELESSQFDVDSKVNDIEDLTNSMIDKANDLDLDLSFLNDGPESGESNIYQ